MGGKSALVTSKCFKSERSALFFFKDLFIYLFEREREHVCVSSGARSLAEGEEGGVKQTPC